jgi:hypothetical protein
MSLVFFLTSFFKSVTILGDIKFFVLVSLVSPEESANMLSLASFLVPSDYAYESSDFSSFFFAFDTSFLT